MRHARQPRDGVNRTRCEIQIPKLYKNLDYLLLKAQRMAAAKTEFVVFKKAA